MMAKRLVVLLLCCAASTAVAANEPSLAGLWGAEEVFGPLVQGPLTIDGRAAVWRAGISGFDVAVTRAGGSVAFTLPRGEGEFQGRADARTRTIIGQWIQPAGVTLGTRYATPVVLNLISPAVWRGDVRPLPDRASFYVAIQADREGKMTAIIRNPEFNLFRRRKYDVTVAGRDVTLKDGKGSVLHGTIDNAADTLSLSLLDARPALLLTRRHEDDAVGFHAKTPNITMATPIAVRPPALDDGWQTASLADVGMKAAPILDLVRKIVDADPADNPLDIDSLLIARHGKLVFEAYFHGFDRDRPHDMRSASKTFAPLLAGIARDRGAAIGPRTRIAMIFKDEAPFANADSRKETVTLQDLMTMTSGLSCDDNDDRSPGNEDTMQNQKAQADWYKYTLDLPMVAAPGGRHAVYCTAGINLIGGAVRRATGRPLVSFFDTVIARPLGFSTYHINLAPTGDAYLGGGLYLRPRDELKLGQLILTGGTWNGKRVVSKQWLDASLTPYARFDPQTDYDAPHDYGYGWHINEVVSGGRRFRAYSAGGNGGQIVMVIPELDLVVGFNGGSYGEFPKWYRWGLQLVPQFIVPAVRVTDHRPMGGERHHEKNR